MEGIQNKKLERLADIEKELGELNKQLTETEVKFCTFYAQTGNQKRSAEMAGYKKTHSHVYGNRLYNKASIKKYINLLCEIDTLDAKASIQEQAWRLQAIASANVSDFVSVDDDGVITIRNLDELTQEQKYAIKTIKPTKFGLEIQFHDKMQAIEMLNRNLGFYKEDNEQSATKIKIGTAADKEEYE